MKITDTSTPVIVFNCSLGGLGIMRSLGRLGIEVYGVDANRQRPDMRSRYCRGRFLIDYIEKEPSWVVSKLIEIGNKIGRKALLIPTSDKTSMIVAEHAEALQDHFLFPKISPLLVRGLASKKDMYHIALEHNIPVPKTLFPERLEDVLAYADKVTYPVMLKAIFGHRLYIKASKSKVIVNSKDQLIKNYKAMDEPGFPNLMIQEYIPGGDDQVYIFNGYFNEQSDCLAGFTGYKVRQFPVHVGCASLGECRRNETVSELTLNFMKQLGYKGVLDIGYRLDQRDGKYKVLDINPRVGQAFRIFVAQNGMDVVRSLYLDMTGQPQAGPVISREGRRWIIENEDITSSYHYYREGTLKPMEWIKSFKGLEEGAWFSWSDPVPFFKMTWRFSKGAFSGALAVIYNARPLRFVKKSWRFLKKMHGRYLQKDGAQKKTHYMHSE